MRTISIDIGNGYVKAVSDTGERLHFPTVIKENLDRDILGKSMNKYSIEINGTKLFIGDLAIAKRGVRAWRGDKAVNEDTEHYIALCAHALTTQSDSEINVCLGLPYSYYISLEKGKKLIAALSGKEFKTNMDGEERSFYINRVSVYPQGVGAYFASLYSLNGRPIEGAENHLRAMFIDVGYRTVDVVAFDCLNSTFELIEENSFSLGENGMFKAINEISNRASGGSDLSENDIEYAIQKNGSKIENMYGDIDLIQFEVESYQRLAKRIVTELNMKLSGEIQRYKNIFLTGGGAAKLYPFMTGAYPNLTLQEDYIFSNANGYMVLENTK